MYPKNALIWYFEVAGKTGTSSGYFDAWFIGYSPQITTSVWVGYDQEQTLGRGEAGGRAALPIWVDFMKEVHKPLPETTFPVPNGVVFATIDNKTGKLVSANSEEYVTQAFIAGTEPKAASDENDTEQEEVDFYKEDLSE